MDLMRLKEHVASIVCSVIGGLILILLHEFTSLSFWPYIVLALSPILIYFSVMFIRISRKLRAVGVKTIAMSMTEGLGAAESILARTRDQFTFMGIAATKWVKADNGKAMEDMLVRLDGKQVRFLLLDPECDEARKFSLRQKGDDDEVSRNIQNNLIRLVKLKDKGHNIEIHSYRFYATFRIAVINDGELYVGFYRGGKQGDDSPQLVLERKEGSFYKPLIEYLKDIWENHSTEIDYDKYREGGA